MGAHRRQQLQQQIQRGARAVLFRLTSTVRNHGNDDRECGIIPHAAAISEVDDRIGHHLATFDARGEGRVAAKDGDYVRLCSSGIIIISSSSRLRPRLRGVRRFRLRR
ncbi:hypothetical protein N9L68_09425 [bacterium]|nr:hypothetical protein [bacterium]